MSEVKIPSLEELLEAGVHFGHTTARWHPKMEKFLYGKRGGIHIIDLKKTYDQLKKAALFAAQVAESKKEILFVGVKPLSRSVVKSEAERAESPYVVNRWIGGMLTNWQAIGSMIKRMKKYEDDTTSGRLAKYTKREQLEFTRDYEKLQNEIGGIRAMQSKPGALFVVDIKYDKTALAEARKLKIPVIAITDSNIDPTKIDHSIPGNDDALKAIALITHVIADSVISGKEDKQP
ncbi:30S ribosomal protein S2 [Patescibacteria group bacterium]|nr:30S ribosomal protein S2 [Patescibacteria group bacterium]